MGKVLRFPESALRAGGDETLPWEVAKISSSLAELRLLLEEQASDESPERSAMRARAAALQETHAGLAQRIRAADADGEWNTVRELMREEREIVTELNEILVQLDPYELGIANALWADQTYPLNPRYVETLAEAYGTGGVFPANFSGDPEGERERINRWAGEQTKGLIPDILPQGSIHDMTRLILANAIYFRGSWLTEFNPENTRTAEFFTGGETLQVPTMRKSGMRTARYAGFSSDGRFFATPVEYELGSEPVGYPEKGFAMLELPYKGDALSMVVLAPTEIDGLAELEASISSQKLSEWLGQLRQRAVNVEMPKFEMSNDISLTKVLRELGMEQAFTDKADFNGMISSTTNRGLVIDDVLHRAVIKVDEEGTEAAAVTTVAIADNEISRKIKFTPTFRADRPFLFLIRDSRTGTILFMGRVSDPTA